MSPPPRSWQGWTKRLRAFMAERGYSRFAIKSYSPVAQAFLDFLATCRVPVASAEPSHIDSFLRRERARYRRRNGRAPLDAGDWRSHYTSPIHLLFRLAQGAWPPRSAAQRHLCSFRSHLEAERYSTPAVIGYCGSAKKFLRFLDPRHIALQEVQPSHVAAFLQVEHRRYQRRHGRPPRELVVWRCSLTGGIHALLRQAQGRWPPRMSNAWLDRFTAHMNATCPAPPTRDHYVCAAGQFLLFLHARGIDLEAVTPEHVEGYYRSRLAAYRKRHSRDPAPPVAWRTGTLTPICRLLRLAHGTWPPVPDEPLLDQLRAELDAARYMPTSSAELVRGARHFLAFIRARGVAPEDSGPAHVAAYLDDRLVRCRRRYGRDPSHPQVWRRGHLRPVERLLRLAQGRWPPEEPPADATEAFRRELLKGYGRWLTELHGFAEPTRRKNAQFARVFLDWLSDRANPDSLRGLSIAQVDAFIAWRNAPLRRPTRRGVTNCLRSFLRYLYGAGYLDRDLGPAVQGPTIYWNEGIPPALTDAEVHALLAATRRDRTPVGRRDYAMLLMLATYGLRAGEVVRLRLEDIDWRREQIRVLRSKRGGESFLPLTPAVGNALLAYLQKRRAASVSREVFLRMRAPDRAITRAGLTALVGRRVIKAGLHVPGRHGPHALRYARAVSLLKAAVPVKTISDVLGHRSSHSTDGYLKLATDDLRQVGLDLPPEVAP